MRKKRLERDEKMVQKMVQKPTPYRVRLHLQWQELYDSLVSKYGQPTTEINMKNSYSPYAKPMLFFEKANVVWFKYRCFDFNEIINCTLINNLTSVDTSVPDSESGASSELSEANVSGVLTEGAEDENHVTKKATKRSGVGPNLTIVLTINSINEPEINIHIGKFGAGFSKNLIVANKIMSVMGVIIHRNEKLASQAVSASMIADEIMKMHKLKELGAITEEEFQQSKRKLMS